MSWPGTNPISRELDDFWKENQSLFQQWWFEADLDTKMATGQQDYYNTFFNNNYRNQKMLQFNKIMRLINMIGGYQRRNRKASIVIPSDNDPDRGVTADDLTGVLNWVKRQDNTYEKISECFDGSNTCGLNLMSVWMDFREDVESGDIRTDVIPFNAFLTSAYWSKQDLSDCDRIWTRKYVTARQLKSLFPGIEKDIPYLGKGYAAKDGKFQFLAQNWYQYQQEMFAYDEYWVRDYRETKKVLDRSTGETVEWKGTKEQFNLFRQMNPNIELIKATVPTIKYHVLVNNNVMYEEVSPWGLDRYPFIPFLAYHYPMVQNYAWRYQGIVRNIRDSQIELNRRRNKLLDILDAQVQSGIMVKEDALVNPEDAFMQGPGKVMYFKNSANLASDVAPFPAPPVAQGWQELIQSLDNEIMSIVGTPEELFGEETNAKEMSGFLMQLKMGAGLTSLQTLFDRLNCSQKYLGDIMIDLIQKNFTPAKAKLILGRDASPEFNDAWATKYHCVTEEAELTDTQRQLQFLQAVQLKQLGIPISNAYILSKSTLSGKKDIIADIEAQEKQMAAQQQAQLMQQVHQEHMVTRSIEAKAQSDFAGAHERMARAVSDIGLAQERGAQAQQDLSQSVLNNVKAMHEMDDMREDRLIKLANFVVDIEAKQQALSANSEALEEAEEDAAMIGTDIDKAEQDTQVQEPKPQQPGQYSNAPPQAA